MENQLLNLKTNFLEGYSTLFIKIVLTIILFYGFILILNFLRDKFLEKEIISKEPQITHLLIILNKLFYIGGFGFIIGNLIQVLFNELSNKLRADWNYLNFGIILVFIGIGFKVAKKEISNLQED